MTTSTKIALVAALAMVSAACQKSETPEEAFARKAAQSVRDSLKDPTSAKFKEVQVNLSGSCMIGKLLAKNSYGAYDGYKDFAWVDSNLFIDPGPDAATGPRAQFDEMVEYQKAQMRCSDKPLTSVPDAALQNS